MLLLPLYVSLRDSRRCWHGKGHVPPDPTQCLFCRLQILLLKDSELEEQPIEMAPRSLAIAHQLRSREREYLQGMTRVDIEASWSRGRVQAEQQKDSGKVEHHQLGICHIKTGCFSS